MPSGDTPVAFGSRPVRRAHRLPVGAHGQLPELLLEEDPQGALLGDRAGRFPKVFINPELDSSTEEFSEKAFEAFLPHIHSSILSIQLIPRPPLTPIDPALAQIWLIYGGPSGASSSRNTRGSKWFPAFQRPKGCRFLVNSMLIWTPC